MSLGYWLPNYWPVEYWDDDYWQDFGTDIGVAVEEFFPRRHRKVDPLWQQLLIEEEELIILDG